jgi:hypothetical protein
VLAGLLILESVAAQENEILIDSQPVSLNKQSVKCDIDEIENVSKRRLVHCDSAKLVELSYQDKKTSAFKFTIKPYDDEISGGVRAELRDMLEVQNNDVVWYRFSTLLPDDFPITSRHRLVLAQWHERTRENVESLRPPLAHRLWDGQFVITLWNQERIDAQGPEGDGQILFEDTNIERGIFYEFVYKITWSADDDGEILGWRRKCPILDSTCSGSDWREIVQHSGATGYSDEKVKSYYFKLGLYTVSHFDETFTAFHRDYMAGFTAADIGINENDIK